MRPRLAQERVQKAAGQAESDSATHDDRWSRLRAELRRGDGAAEIRLARASGCFQRVASACLSDAQRPLKRVAARTSRLTLAPSLLTALVTGSVLCGLVWKCGRGAMTVADVVAAVLLAQQLQESTWLLPNLWSQIAGSTRAAKRLLCLERYAAERADAGAAPSQGTEGGTPGAIVADNGLGEAGVTVHV